MQRSPTRIELPGVRVVRSRRFDIETIPERRDGLRLTSPEHTLFDIARQLREPQRSHLLQSQFVAKLPTAEAFEHFVTHNQGRGIRNAWALQEALAAMLDDQPFPDSVLEKIMFDGLMERGIRLERQFSPSWYDGRRGIVDGCEPVGATIAEADGRRYRQVSHAHDNDRRRDLQAMSHGFVVVRASHYMMTREPTQTFDRMAQVIDDRKRLALSQPVAVREAN